MTKKNKTNKDGQTEKQKEKEMMNETETTETPEGDKGNPTGKTEKPAKQPDMQTLLDEKDKEIEKVKERLLRQAAEYDNYRKRTAKERIELEPDITAKIVTEFLPILDNLERALAAECTDEQYKTGVQMIYDSFMQTLEKLGVEEIKTDGSFDPSVHQAVTQVHNEEQESGQVAETFQKGYRIGEKVLRFSMVSVYA